MMFSSRLRKLVLAGHLAFSLGWLGAAVAYLVLASTGIANGDAQVVRAVHALLVIVGWFVLVPFSLGALVTGTASALGTEWGLLRHWWIVGKLGITLAATVVLFVHMNTVESVAQMAATAAEVMRPGFRSLQVQLIVHAAGGVTVLLVLTALSVYKPFGRTSFEGASAARAMALPRGVYIIGAVLLLAILLHLFGGVRMH